jgi:hypothetical protein
MRSARFAALAERLLRAGVSPRNTRRTVFELEGHLADLIEEHRARGASSEEARADATARLGSDDELMARVLARPELRSWTYRRPWAAFLVMPILGFALLFVASLVELVALFEFAKSALGITPSESGVLQGLGDIIRILILWALPGVVAIAVCVVAARQRIRALWPVMGVLLIGFVGALTNVGMDWPPHEQGQLSAGIGIGKESLAVSPLRALLTVALALVPFFVWRLTRGGAGRVSVD